MGDLVVFIALVVAVAVGGVRIGMLVSARVGRMADRIDADPEPPAAEEPRDDA